MTREEMLNECVSRDKVIVQLNHLKSDWDDDWNVAIRKCIETIKKLPPVTPQQRWIPVSERLPEEYKEVIVTDIETSDTYLSRYIGNGYWECDTGRFKNRIIAWMPLPEPYKSEIPTGAEGSEE